MRSDIYMYTVFCNLIAVGNKSFYNKEVNYDYLIGWILEDYCLIRSLENRTVLTVI